LFGGSAGEARRMIVYFSVAAFSAFLSFFGLDRKLDKNYILVLMVSVTFALVIGLRWGTTDFHNYSSHFYRALGADDLASSYSMFRDGGHGILLYSLTRLFSDPVFYFLSYSIAAISAMFYVFYRTSPFFLLSVFIYVTNGGFHQDAAQMRQGLTSSLVLLALYFLYMNRKSVWFVLVSVSASVQFSSAPAFFSIFVRHMRSRVFMLAALALAALIGFLGGIGRVVLSAVETPIAFAMGGHQFSRLLLFLEFDSPGLPLGFMNFGYLFSILFIFFSRRIVSQSPIAALFIPIIFLGNFILVAFQDLGIIAERLSDTLTYGVEPVLWAALLRSFRGFEQAVLFFCVIAFFSVKFINTVVSSGFSYSFVFLN